MTRWSRRRFLGATAAAACVGCGPGDDDGGVTAGTAVPAPPDELPPTLPAFEVEVGPLDEVVERLASEGALYVPAARAWVVPVLADLDLGAYDELLHAGLRAGFAGLHQQCPHLGCRVPHCSSSGWFECPCHGTRFDGLGEHRSGPAPRGMDHFVVRIDDGIVLIDTGRVIAGVPLGAATVVAEPVGPHCVELNDP